jgi:hypothetical protein
MVSAPVCEALRFAPAETGKDSMDNGRLSEGKQTGTENGRHLQYCSLP